MIIAKYTANASGVVPTFNDGYQYTVNEVESNGVYTVEINSDSDFSSCSFKDKSELLTVEYLKVTSNVIDMDNMFQNCSQFTQLDVSNWDTSNVTSIKYIFQSCSKLTQLDVSNFDTSNVTTMYAMFNGCSQLTTIGDVSNWDTSTVKNMGYMFSGCSQLTTIGNISNWVTSNVENMSWMFASCSKLSQLDVSNFNTSKVTTMNGMFSNCSSLTQLDVSNWDTSKVTDMGAMFRDSSKLTTIGGISNWDTSSVTTMTSMFYNCFKLTQLDLRNWNTSNVTNMSQMFNNCDSLYKVNLKYSNEATVSKIHESLPDRSSLTKGCILSSLDLTSDKNWMVAKFTHNKLNLPQPLRKIGNIKDKFYWDDDKGHYCIEQNISDTLEVLETPNIIDLPHLNKKYSFDTYLPSTSVNVVNSLLQPYSLLLEADTVRYKSTIKPSTLYTIQFNCLAKSTTNLTLDLGGSRVTIDPIIGLNHVQITTPSELASDRLFLIGTGIIVKEVIVNKGDMTQYPKYFDGEQSVGVLQGDNTYKIDIKTNEDFIISIKTDLPLTKDDKLYWNDTEKRYEIDRNGAIEVPTVEGDIINLPRLYQKVDTTISISTDNIEPSKIDISYKDIH